MDTPSLVSRIKADTLFAFQKRLEALYADMDKAYEASAAAYGFSCTGCKDNCCLTRFHHHTLAEFAYLEKGFGTMAQADRQAAACRAGEVLARYEAAETDGAPPRAMCPLNGNQRCLLYRYRPMICRMHGIPHVLRAPGRQPAFGTGCAAFTERCRGRRNDVFDRTPFYRQMAALENEIRSAVGFAGKIKMTIAEMVLLFCERAP